MNNYFNCNNPLIWIPNRQWNVKRIRTTPSPLPPVLPPRPFTIEHLPVNKYVLIEIWRSSKYPCILFMIKTIKLSTFPGFSMNAQISRFKQLWYSNRVMLQFGRGHDRRLLHFRADYGWNTAANHWTGIYFTWSIVRPVLIIKCCVCSSPLYSQ